MHSGAVATLLIALSSLCAHSSVALRHNDNPPSFYLEPDGARKFDGT